MKNLEKANFPVDLHPFPTIVLNLEDTDFEILSANDAFCQLNGLSRNKVAGNSLLKLPLFSTNESDVKYLNKLRETLGSVSETKNPEKFYYSLSPRDQSNGSTKPTIWMIEISALSTDDQKQVLLLSFHDISGLRNEPKIYSQLWLGKEEGGSKRELEKEIVQSDTLYKALTEELNNFMYSVSHDLRAPLRRIDGFSQELINEYTDQLDETGAHYLSRIRQGAQDMGVLIDELLKLSRLSRREVSRRQIDIGTIAEEVFNELYELENEPDIEIIINDNLEAYADPGLVKILLMNLLSNAFKFTSNEENAAIEIGRTTKEGTDVFFVKDNGAGFDPAHADKLFKAFSRLHSQKEFSGSGIGLATVQRVISLHGGHIWGEGQPGEGAEFYFNFE